MTAWLHYISHKTKTTWIRLFKLLLSNGRKAYKYYLFIFILYANSMNYLNYGKTFPKIFRSKQLVKIYRFILIQGFI